MSDFERPGVNAKWLKRLNTWYKGDVKEWHESEVPDVINRLEDYIERGFVFYSRPEPTSYGRWGDLYQALHQYARMRIVELEVKGTSREARFDAQLAVRAYAAHYFGSLVQLDGYGKFSFAGYFSTALGIIIDGGESTFQLARMEMRGYRAMYAGESRETNDELVNDNPVSAFLYAMLAEFLDEPPFLPDGVTLDEPIAAALLKHWKDPEPKVIEEACLAMCDFHTHMFDRPENFMHTPIEILLLFKLRILLGLKNPQLDHPIMNTPLGKLPEDIPPLNDDLLDRVRARMIMDGFDEASALGEDSEWCTLHRQSVRSTTSTPLRKLDLDGGIVAATKALAIAEKTTPDGPRVFNSLHALAEMHRMKGLDVEAAVYLERALGVADRNAACNPALILKNLTTIYQKLNRQEDAQALLQKRA